MSRPDLVLQLGPSHDAVALLRNSLAELRPQLRDRGVAFAAFRDSDDLVNTVVQVLDAERELTRPRGAGPSAALISWVSAGPQPSPADGSGGAGPYPDAIATVRRVVEATGASCMPVVLHVARQDRLMERAYHDAVLAGGSHQFADQFPRLDEPQLDYGPLVNQLEAVPQVLDVRVRPVELAATDTGSFVDDVLDAVGLGGQLDLATVSQAVPANRRLSARGLRIAAAMNAHLDDDDERASVRDFLLEQFAVPDSKAAAGILGDDDRARILCAHAQANRALFARYLPDLPAEMYCNEASTGAS